MAHGAMISVTSALAGLAVYFALRMSLTANFFFSAIIAIVAGMLVMAVDRWLIVSVARGGNIMRTLLISLMPRVAFGLLLSVIIAVPILLQIFRPEINNQITVMATQRSATFYTSATVRTIEQQVSADQTRVNELVNMISNTSKESTTAVSVAKGELPEAQSSLQIAEEQEN
jgi:hypothetical protein